MRIDARLVFCLYCLVAFVVSIAFPWVLGDDNVFLSEFMNHEFLNFMGVVVTITLASTANIHIALRRKEEIAGEEFLSGTKERVRASAFSLIWAMFLSIGLVIAKPLLPDGPEFDSVANSIGLGIILWGILIILDITKLAFKL